MKISTKGRYGIRFMLDIAVHGNGQSVSLKDVANRQHISEKYLWQVVNPLKSAGLVAVTRGAKGGFMLNRDPDQVTLKDVLDAVEGDSILVDCAVSSESCRRGFECVMQSVWRELSQKVADAMSGVTLKSIMERQKAIDRGGALDFAI